MIISIEGNIGSGKSSFMRMLKEHYKNHSRVICIDEPVNEWGEITDENGKSILECFYADQNKYAFPFQILTFMTRLIRLQECLDKHPDSILITERSILTDSLFAELVYKEGKISKIEYDVYKKQFEYFIQRIPEIHIIYLYTDPEVCLERIHKRSRKGEHDIPLSYLKSLHDVHESFMGSYGCARLNGNKDKKETISDYKKWIHFVNWCFEGDDVWDEGAIFLEQQQLS